MEGADKCDFGELELRLINVSLEDDCLIDSLADGFENKERGESPSSRDMNILEGVDIRLDPGKPRTAVVIGNSPSDGEEHHQFQSNSNSDCLPLPLVKPKVTGKCNLRKSLAWDKAFFTSSGILEPEELSSMIGEVKINVKHSLAVIEEDLLQNSTDSLSTLISSEGSSAETIEEFSRKPEKAMTKSRPLKAKPKEPNGNIQGGARPRSSTQVKARVLGSHPPKPESRNAKNSGRSPWVSTVLPLKKTTSSPAPSRNNSHGGKSSPSTSTTSLSSSSSSSNVQMRKATPPPSSSSPGSVQRSPALSMNGGGITKRNDPKKSRVVVGGRCDLSSYVRMTSASSTSSSSLSPASSVSDFSFESSSSSSAVTVGNAQKKSSNTSGLRMPSPKIGFFDAAKATVQMQKGGAAAVQMHRSGAAAMHLRPPPGAGRSSKNACERRKKIVGETEREAFSRVPLAVKNAEAMVADGVEKAPSST